MKISTFIFGTAASCVLSANVSAQELPKPTEAEMLAFLACRYETTLPIVQKNLDVMLGMTQKALDAGYTAEKLRNMPLEDRDSTINALPLTQEEKAVRAKIVKAQKFCEKLIPSAFQ